MLKVWATYLKSCAVGQALKLVQGVLYAVAIPAGRKHPVGRADQHSTTAPCPVLSIFIVAERGIGKPSIRQQGHSKCMTTRSCQDRCFERMHPAASKTCTGPIHLRRLGRPLAQPGFSSPAPVLLALHLHPHNEGTLGPPHHAVGVLLLGSRSTRGPTRGIPAVQGCCQGPQLLTPGIRVLNRGGLQQVQRQTKSRRGHSLPCRAAPASAAPGIDGPMRLWP